MIQFAKLQKKMFWFKIYFCLYILYKLHNIMSLMMSLTLLNAASNSKTNKPLHFFFMFTRSYFKSEIDHVLNTQFYHYHFFLFVEVFKIMLVEVAYIIWSLISITKVNDKANIFNRVCNIIVWNVFLFTVFLVQIHILWKIHFWQVSIQAYNV